MGVDDRNPHCYIPAMVRRSSAVEQLTVNQLVVGSIPTAGANFQNIDCRQCIALSDQAILGNSYTKFSTDDDASGDT